MATRILSQALQRASRPTFQLFHQKQQPKVGFDIFPFPEAGTTQASSFLQEQRTQHLQLNESLFASRFMLQEPPSVFSSLRVSESRPEISDVTSIIDPFTLLRFTNSSYLASPSEIQEVILPSIDEETASPMLMSTKRTFNPSTIVRKRRHGYLARKATVGGRRILARRFAKGRRRLSA